MRISFEVEEFKVWIKDLGYSCCCSACYYDLELDKDCIIYTDTDLHKRIDIRGKLIEN